MADIVITCPDTGSGGAVLLHQDTDVVDFRQTFLGELEHDCPTVRFRDQKSLCFQTFDCVADRGAADAKCFGEAFLGDMFAWLKLTLNNCIFDPEID